MARTEGFQTESRENRKALAVTPSGRLAGCDVVRGPLSANCRALLLNLAYRVLYRPEATRCLLRGLLSHWPSREQLRSGSAQGLALTLLVQMALGGDIRTLALPSEKF